MAILTVGDLNTGTNQRLKHHTDDACLHGAVNDADILPRIPVHRQVGTGRCRKTGNIQIDKKR